MHVNQNPKISPKKNFPLFKVDITNFGCHFKNMTTDMTFLLSEYKYRHLKLFLFANIIIEH